MTSRQWMTVVLRSLGDMVSGLAGALWVTVTIAVLMIWANARDLSNSLTACAPFFAFFLLTALGGIIAYRRHQVLSEDE